MSDNEKGEILSFGLICASDYLKARLISLAADEEFMIGEGVQIDDLDEFQAATTIPDKSDLELVIEVFTNYVEQCFSSNAQAISKAFKDSMRFLTIKLNKPAQNTFFQSHESLKVSLMTQFHHIFSQEIDKNLEAYDTVTITNLGHITS